MKEYAFGVDLGGTTIKFGLFKTNGELLKKWEIPTDTENCGGRIIPDIAESIKKAMTDTGITPYETEGIGIGVPGSVLNDSYINPCVNLNGWGGFNAAEKIGELTGMPAKVLNDANAAALGEMWQGGGKGYDNLVFVTIGTGVGGGIIVNGKIRSGSHGAGGEIGHIKVKVNEEQPCGCGKRGCLEQYASATGLVRMTKEALRNSGTASRLRNIKTEMTSKDVFDAYKAGDPLAAGMIERMFDYLGMALADVSCVCDPDVFVIGGGVSKTGDILTSGIQRSYKKYAFPSAEAVEFVLASLGNDAGIYGSVKMILEEVQ